MHVTVAKSLYITVIYRSAVVKCCGLEHVYLNYQSHALHLYCLLNMGVCAG